MTGQGKARLRHNATSASVKALEVPVSIALKMNDLRLVWLSVWKAKGKGFQSESLNLKDWEAVELVQKLTSLFFLGSLQPIAP